MHLKLKDRIRATEIIMDSEKLKKLIIGEVGYA